MKRGTLVRHPKYGLCCVGGFDRKRQTVSLHEYRSNKRLTQGAQVKECRVLTWVAFRSWFIRKKQPLKKGLIGIALMGRRVAREFLARLGVAPAKQWLDIGCGAGTLSQVPCRR